MVHEADDLAAAFRLHQAGQLRPAEDRYRQIVAANPGNAQAWHLLGVLAHQTSRPSEAVECISRAVQLCATNADFYNHLGAAHGAAGNYSQAEQAFEQALQLNPGDAQIHFNLGALLGLQGRTAEAIASYRRAIAIDPSLADAHFNLANSLRDERHFDPARTHYEHALRLNPRYSKAWINLGHVLRDMNQFSDAQHAYTTALELNPRHVEAHYGLGLALQEQQHDDQAVESFRAALALRPDHAETEASLAVSLGRLGRIAESVAALERAIAIKPDFAEAHNNLGSALQLLGLWDQSLASFEEAIRVRPDFIPALYNRSLVLLAKGDLPRGWQEYQWRLREVHYESRFAGHAAWDGSPLAGRTLFVHAEQGLGDTLHFIRYVSMISGAGKLIVEVQEALIPLLEKSGFSGLVPQRPELPTFDTHISLLSFPRVFKTTLERIPAAVPYLAADAQLIDRWAQTLNKIQGFKVGIAWQGNPALPLDRYRSIPLVEFAALAQVPGVQVVSLQKKVGLQQLSEVSKRISIVDFGGQLDETAGPFMDTAAVMKNLDLVITSDTSIAHLAGALGIPVWVGLGLAADWRWLLDRDDSPWYPTMRLFRQRWLDDWSDVFAHMAAELSEHISRPAFD